MPRSSPSIVTRAATGRDWMTSSPSVTSAGAAVAGDQPADGARFDERPARQAPSRNASGHPWPPDQRPEPSAAGGRPAPGFADRRCNAAAARGSGDQLRWAAAVRALVPLQVAAARPAPAIARSAVSRHGRVRRQRARAAARAGAAGGGPTVFSKRDDEQVELRRRRDVAALLREHLLERDLRFLRRLEAVSARRTAARGAIHRQNRPRAACAIRRRWSRSPSPADRQRA